MAIKAGTAAITNRVPQENIEPGSYPARIVSVVDMGVQLRDAFEGKAKAPARFLRVTYELTDVFMLDEDGNELEDKPRWIAEEFALLPMTSELAVSTKRSKVIDPDDVHDGDWSQYLGTGVMVSIINKPDKKIKGKFWDNISGVAPMRRKDLEKLPELKNPAFFFDLDEPDPAIWKKLPKWIQDKIVKNINFQGSPLQELVGDAPAPQRKERNEPKDDDAGDDGNADGADDNGADAVNEDAPW